MGLTIHVDGGARGNPGPAGAGVVIQDDDGTRLYEAAFYLGRQTNNAAEYQALIRALDRAVGLAPERVRVFSDSELLVRQLTGEYQVKSPKLAPLFEQVQLRLLRLGRWSVQHVRREQNARADELANLAMDRQRDVLVFDAVGGNVSAGAAPPAEAEVRELPQAARRSAPPAACPPVVRVRVTRGPSAAACPAGGFGATSFEVRTTLPEGWCLHAAHALLPTLLAVLNMDPQERAAVPRMTVRCGRRGCRAEFEVEWGGDQELESSGDQA